tara:strand:- start:65 stop:388 length:324 start_codon:yes stop_codon:yes gene_type:complete
MPKLSPIIPKLLKLFSSFPILVCLLCHLSILQGHSQNDTNQGLPKTAEHTHQHSILIGNNQAIRNLDSIILTLELNPDSSIIVNAFEDVKAYIKLAILNHLLDYLKK